MARSRDTRRRILPTILLVVAITAIVRIAGPTVVSVRGNALAPLVREGDLLFGRRPRNVPERRSIVLVRGHAPTAGILPGFLARRINVRRSPEGTTHDADRTVPRVLAAVPGDTVRFDLTQVVVVGEDGYVHRYDLGSFHERLGSDQRQVRVGDGEVFLIANDAGFVDSRILGPIPSDDIQFVITAILWPADRRSRL